MNQEDTNASHTSKFLLHKSNWENDGNLDSLYLYALALKDGSGCEKDEPLAFNLLKLHYEKTKDKAHRYYRYAYAHCLHHGIGCEKNEALAKEILSNNDLYICMIEDTPGRVYHIC